ncbi:hypothetical protein SAMN05519104_1617 [Rhizobiales bacterium GAS188]|nr:hypothetical protein SAMN05519104_1617 [Rhizobiales bacterium GAS188]
MRPALIASLRHEAGWKPAVQGKIGPPASSRLRGGEGTGGGHFKQTPTDRACYSPTGQLVFAEIASKSRFLESMHHQNHYTMY